ncbi:hypothetical protein DFAR_150005 [Desulfarculales bacterium]
MLKLENPVGGDYARGIGGGLRPAYFATLNRGKKSLALNLKHAKGHDICLQFLESHDILVEGSAPAPWTAWAWAMRP